MGAGPAVCALGAQAPAAGTGQRPRSIPPGPVRGSCCGSSTGPRWTLWDSRPPMRRDSAPSLSHTASGPPSTPIPTSTCPFPTGCSSRGMTAARPCTRPAGSTPRPPEASRPSYSAASSARPSVPPPPSTFGRRSGRPHNRIGGLPDRHSRSSPPTFRTGQSAAGGSPLRDLSSRSRGRADRVRPERTMIRLPLASRVGTPFCWDDVRLQRLAALHTCGSRRCDRGWSW